MAHINGMALCRGFASSGLAKLGRVSASACSVYPVPLGCSDVFGSVAAVRVSVQMHLQDAILSRKEGIFLTLVAAH